MKPAGTIAPQPWMTSAPTRAVMAALGAQGGVARFVGGCVRDAYLERPVEDVDIATAEPPETVLALLETAGIKAVPTGIAHGTVTAVVPPEHYEITTLREDVETHGRHATVAYTDDWMADAARRDLTMNALFLDPDGTLYDPFDGLKDLRAGRVRFVGAARQRIEEDYLRLLRFFRFHAYYGRSEPDAEGLAACTALAPHLEKLSAERVWSETRKLLLAPSPEAVFALMAAAGVLAHVLPHAHEIARLGLLAAREAAHDEPDAVRRLAAVLDLTEPHAASTALVLKLSNADRDQLEAIAREWPGFTAESGAPARRSLYRLGARRVYDLVLLRWAEAERGTGADLDDAPFRAALDEAAAWTPKALPVQGADVLVLGVPAGPAIGEILAQAEAWWIDRDFKPSRAALLKQLKVFANPQIA
jgi:poly(A) polymerase